MENRTTMTSGIFKKSVIMPSSVKRNTLKICLLAFLTTSSLGAGGILQAAASEDLGFSISVDGETIAGVETAEAKQRYEDVALDQVDIQVKFDGLGIEPRLNVSTTDLRSAYQAGESIEFLATNNYPAWIAGSEIRIFERGARINSNPVQVLPVSRSGHASWEMPVSNLSGDGDFYYVLRVYDESGRFDETAPLNLSRTSSAFDTHQTTSQVVAAGAGDDRTAVRNIPVYGGAVTVFGRNVPEGVTVSALGSDVFIDDENQFVVQHILPPGYHSVDVDLATIKGDGLKFNREINIPENEWFYVGLADFTFGRRLGDSILSETAPGEYKSTYTKGRLAFYLKGKIRGKYLLTAAADTSEKELRNLFRGLDEKDPRSLLKRIDPDEYYPVYGDDSTYVEDAPTKGKFYIRLERGDSHVMWGNYKTQLKGTKFIRNDRTLYGAHAILRSEQVTAHGDRKAELEVYASQPDTLAQRDEMRGTGGSAYFLTRQDITRGSQTVYVEVRDLTTGRVVSRTALLDGKDYKIDYAQGVIILNTPLASTGTGGNLISSSAIGNHSLNLVVQYEYTPTSGEVDGYSFGGRAKTWLGDHIRVGVSGVREETGVSDQTNLGADIHVRLGDNSFIEGEIAKSEGPGFGRSRSINGGLTITNSGTSGIVDRTAMAYSLKGQIDLSDIDPSSKGIIGAYYEEREQGFSTTSYETNVAQRIWGAHADFEANDYLSYRLNYEDFKDVSGKTKIEGNAEVEAKFNENVALRIGAKYTDLTDPAVAINNGERVDIGARLTYTYDDDHKVYIFGQGTVKRRGNIERNNRYGIGAQVKLSEKVGIRGEISDGTNGIGAIAALTYDPTADDHYYFGYQLDADRVMSGSSLFGTDLGTIVVGAKRRYNELLAAYVENNYDMFGDRRSLTSTYGVTYTPDASWTINGDIEYGDIEDPDGADLTRTAISLGIGYKDTDDISWRIRGEARFEDSTDLAKDRDTYLASASLSYKADENWRFIANVDAVISENYGTSILDGDYVEASLGYAYRPVDNDKFNALFKYTYLYDLPGPDQVTVNNGTLGPAQRSHILSADFVYDISNRWTVGAKYGYRRGEVSADRTVSSFTTSTAHLAVLRADYHYVKNWDAFAEARMLKATEIGSVDYGFVAGIYRHVGDNLKIGVGYNFGKFSDDITDLTHDDGGVFLNVVGKF